MITIFFRNQGGKILYARGVGLAKDVAYPLKFSSSKATRAHQGKAKSHEPYALNETMLPMQRKKSFTISHTQHKTPPIPIPISPKEKEWGCEKKRRPTLGARISKQSIKNRRKVKKKLIKLH